MGRALDDGCPEYKKIFQLFSSGLFTFLAGCDIITPESNNNQPQLEYLGGYENDEC